MKETRECRRNARHVAVRAGAASAARRATRSLAVALVVATALSALPACESSLGRSFRGARLLASGTAALDRGEVDRAVADLEAAAQLVPEASEVQNHLGIAHWRRGALPEARASFDRAIELDCDNEAARENLRRFEAATRD